MIIDTDGMLKLDEHKGTVESSESFLVLDIQVAEILGDSVEVWLESFLARLPIGRADVPMLVIKLISLKLTVIYRK